MTGSINAAWEKADNLHTGGEYTGEKYTGEKTFYTLDKRTPHNMTLGKTAVLLRHSFMHHSMCCVLHFQLKQRF